MLPFLQGVRVVEITTIILGSMAGQMLGDLGADVVKIETLEGDLARQIPPLSEEGIGAMFVNNNRNKASLGLDLKTPEGREILHRLVDEADVFLHNMRPDAAGRLGCDAATLRARNAKLVYCAAIGFGSEGPYAGKPAFDDVIQAACGLASLPLAAGGAPAYAPSVMADKTVALYAAIGVLAALRQAERTGRGVELEIPMFETMASFLLNEHLDAATFDHAGQPGYRRMLNPHRRPHCTADGWIAVLPYTDAQWRRALTEIGRDDLLAAPWMSNPTQRAKNIGALYEALGDALRLRTTQDWLDLFARIDIPHARVNSLSDLLDDPHLRAVGFFEPTDDLPGRARSVPLPIRAVDGCAATPDKRPLALGASTDATLRALGYDETRIAALRRDDVIA